MIYLLFGQQELMIKSRLQKLIKENLPIVDEFSLVKFNGRETLVQEVVNECQLMPLGSDKKMVVLEDCYFLQPSKAKEKIEKDQNYDVMENYLKRPNESSDLVLTVTNKAFNTKSSIGKILKQGANIYELTDIDKFAWPEYVRRYFAKHNVTIDNKAVDELVKRSQNDAGRFVSEAQKLLLAQNHITYDLVVALVSRPLEEDAFALSNALMKGRMEEAISIFRDLKTFSEEPVMLISLLARHFRLYLKVLYLSKQGLSLSEITKQLGIHEYRVKLALESQRHFNEARLLNILDQLYMLDFQIKSGQVDRFYGFELFLLNFKP